MCRHYVMRRRHVLAQKVAQKPTEYFEQAVVRCTVVLLERRREQQVFADALQLADQAKANHHLLDLLYCVLLAA